MIRDRKKVQKALQEKFCLECDHFLTELDECDTNLDLDADCVVASILDNIWDWTWSDE